MGLPSRTLNAFPLARVNPHRGDPCKSNLPGSPGGCKLGLDALERSLKMKAILAAGFTLAILTGAAYGQSRGLSSPPNTFGSTTGFGRVLFPGTGGPPPAGRIGGPIVGARSGGFIGGGGIGRRGGDGRGRTVIVLYGIPYYVGGGYGYGNGYGNGYGEGEQPPPPQTVVVQQPAPPVIINQYYSPEVAHPVMREYSDLPAPIRREPEESKDSNVKVYPPPARQPAPERPAQRDDEKPNITLLAFKDGAIIAAIGYWVQDGELHYITAQYAKRTVPAASLDKDLTEQLNRERNVDFRLQ
jgi:hypothetical protein